MSTVKTAVDVAVEKIGQYTDWQSKIAYIKGLDQKTIQALSENKQIMEDVQKIVEAHGNTEEFRNLKAIKLA
jgi:hypothetical protein